MFPNEDLTLAASHVDASEWQRLDGKRVFITGGTGFVGKWLLSTLMHSSSQTGATYEVVVLTRSIAKFERTTPWLASARGVQLVQGDVANFEFPQGVFDTIIHGATDVEAVANPIQVFDTCIAGTRRVLEFAQLAKAKNLLLVSSGAVYGRMPPEVDSFAETHGGAPEILSPRTGYGQGKRAAEWLASTLAADSGMRMVSARLFALIGPGMPFDNRFAIGNFIRDAMTGSSIVIGGDGTPLRSYLHAADMAGWMWKILFEGRAGNAYNVGGSESISIESLARRVASLLGSSAEIEIRGVAKAGRESADRYIPDISKARDELKLREALTLDESIVRTARWCRSIADRP